MILIILYKILDSNNIVNNNLRLIGIERAYLAVIQDKSNWYIILNSLNLLCLLIWFSEVIFTY